MMLPLIILNQSVPLTCLKIRDISSLKTCSFPLNYTETQLSFSIPRGFSCCESLEFSSSFLLLSLESSQ